MNSNTFHEFGSAALQLISNYHDNIRDRNVLPAVSPGFMQNVIPNNAPQFGEPWQNILKDVEEIVLPGMTHWQSPKFHAYFTSGCSYPSMIGEMLSSAIACQNSDWTSGPACTELEMIMMDWLARLLGLPEEFLNCSEGPGGGVIQSSASEATLIGLMTAREKTVQHYLKLYPEMDQNEIRSKLIAYSSDQSNSSVEKAGIHASVPIKLLPVDKTCSLSAKTLREAIKSDRNDGFIPCCLVVNLGTTATCAFDNLEELGPVCKEEKIWMHADAAYAGTALCCEELRPLMNGLEYLDSFNFNPHKWMLVNYDLSAMWIKDSTLLKESFSVHKTQQEISSSNIPDYRYWQIALERKFKSLKLWFVLRSYGAEGIRSYVRKHVELAKYFESLVLEDDRFEVTNKPQLGILCFRAKGKDHLTEKLLDKLMERKHIYVIPAIWDEKLIIRFVVCGQTCNKQDLIYSWKEISSQLEAVIKEENKETFKTINDIKTARTINTLNQNNERWEQYGRL